jgi:hypothetical protein
MRVLLLLGIAACAGTSSSGTLATLRPACPATAYWTGTACTARGDVGKVVADAKAAIVDQDPDKASAAFAAADAIGPMDHASYVSLWEQRAIMAGFMADEPASKSAFGMVLALDPRHLIAYGLKAQVTQIFEAARAESQQPPEVDIAWPSGLETTDPIPLDVEVLSDPKQFLRRATVFVRARGDAEWRASDLPLSAKPTRVLIPPLRTAKSTALELYLRAYDDKGNEVLAWSDPVKPREIPLRYDPPPKWYRNWKTYAIGGTAAVLITGLVVYAVTLSPPDDAAGSGVVR